MLEAQILRAVSGLNLHKTYVKPVNTTQTIEEITAVALPTNVAAVRVENASDTLLRFQNGAASATSAAMAVVGATNDQNFRTFYGSKAQLDALEFFTGAGSKNAMIEVYTKRDIAIP